MWKSKIHTSHYEDDLGWININTCLPEHSTRVKIAHIRIIDWNIEELIWEAEGWITKGNNWSLSMNKLIEHNNILTFGYNDKPTHWKKI